MSVAVTSSCYQPLPSGSGNIRLLRLLSSEDEHLPIQCQLINHSLQSSSKQPHLYDALSYVWGSEEKPFTLSVDKCDFPITASLHHALSRLRDHSFERLLWADAVCINQGDIPEKQIQIQLMARIYSQANRVIVWLGESADDSDLALATIRIAGSQRGQDAPTDKRTQRAIIALLQRQWFRRIWVLQEVGAARHIRIMCGSSEIDGYAFCLGVDALKSLHNDQSDLESLLHAVTYLIRGAIFRPLTAVADLDRSTLGICALGELLDMYHTHQSTVHHDKLYALLGMCTEDLNRVGLSPDYSLPWEGLMQRLCRYLLGEQISVQTWANSEIAHIKTKGCILGTISAVDADMTWGDRLYVNVTRRREMSWNETERDWDLMRDNNTKPGLSWRWSWSIQTSANPVRIGDIVCQLESCSNLTIIRPSRDHLTIIMIAVVPPQYVTAVTHPQHDSGSIWKIDEKYFKSTERSISWLEFWASIDFFNHSFLLVWDWETRKCSSAAKTHQILVNEDGIWAHSQNFQHDHPARAVRLWEVVVVLLDAAQFDDVEDQLGGLKQELDEDKCVLLAEIRKSTNFRTTKGLQAHFGERFVLLMREKYSDPPLHGIALSFKDSVLFLLECFAVDEDFMTFLFIELRAIDISWGNWSNTEGGHIKWRVLNVLTNPIEDASLAETVFFAASKAWSERNDMVMLLDLISNDSFITEAVLVKAAEHSEPFIMTLLLERRSEGWEAPVTETVVKAAARNEQRGMAIMTLLLNRGKNRKVPVTEDVILAAARNRYCGDSILGLLFDRRGEDVLISETVIEAAIGHGSVYPNMGALKCILAHRGGMKAAVAAAAEGHPHKVKIIAMLSDPSLLPKPLTEPSLDSSRLKKWTQKIKSINSKT